METMPPNPLVALTWTASTLLGAAVIVSLLLVLLINLGTADPVPADQVRWEAVFTEEEAVLEGPTLVQAGLIDLTLANATGKPITLAAFRFTDEASWMAELNVLAVGDEAVAGPDDAPEALIVMNAEVGPNSESTRAISMTRGFYVFDWVALGRSGAVARTWRIAAVEVVD